MARYFASLGMLGMLGCAGGEGPPKPSITSTPAGVDDPTGPSDSSDPTDSGDPTDETDATASDSTTGGMNVDETTGDIDPHTTAPVDPSSTAADMSDGSSDESSGDPVPSCDLAQICQNAELLGGLPGDESGPPLTATGTEPIWFEFQVSEQNSGIAGAPMNVTVRLDSVGGDFDLNAYLGMRGGTTGCSGLQQSSTQSAGIDAVSFEWGETGPFANNEHDGAFIAVWIYPKSNTCMPGESWTLTVTGG